MVDGKTKVGEMYISYDALDMMAAHCLEQHDLSPNTGYVMSIDNKRGTIGISVDEDTYCTVECEDNVCKGQARGLNKKPDTRFIKINQASGCGSPEQASARIVDIGGGWSEDFSALEDTTSADKDVTTTEDVEPLDTQSGDEGGDVNLLDAIEAFIDQFDTAKPEDVTPEQKADETGGEDSSVDAQPDVPPIEQPIVGLSFKNPTNEPADKAIECGFASKPTEWLPLTLVNGDTTYDTNTGIPLSVFLNEPVDGYMTIKLMNQSGNIYNCDMSMYNKPGDPTPRWNLSCSNFVGADGNLIYDDFNWMVLDLGDMVYIESTGNWSPPISSGLTCYSVFGLDYNGGN